MIVATAPGRCGILGNPTDMYGGAVISCTTVERARCELTDADILTLQVGAETLTIRTTTDLVLQGDRFDLPKAVLQGLGITPEAQSFHLQITTDIPMQAGLAGSTALVAAIYGAVWTKTTGALPPRHLVAEAIRHIEYDILGVICGFQDQYMTVFGGLNYMDFTEKGSHLGSEQPLATVEPLADVMSLPLPLVLAHTGVKHHSGAAHKPVRQRWLDGDPQVRDAYARLMHLTRQSKGYLLTNNWAAMADAMNENQQIQSDLGASGEACDRLIGVARANGAIAAKLAGAGHGGTILAVTHDPERIAQALTAAGAGRILFPAPTPGLVVEQ